MRRLVRVWCVAIVASSAAACSDGGSSLTFCEAIAEMNTGGGIGVAVSSDGDEPPVEEQIASSLDRIDAVSTALRTTAPDDVAAEAQLLADVADAQVAAFADSDPDDPLAVLDVVGGMPAGIDSAQLDAALRAVSAAAERDCGTGLRAVEALDAADAAARDAAAEAAEAERLAREAEADAARRIAEAQEEMRQEMERTRDSLAGGPGAPTPPTPGDG